MQTSCMKQARPQPLQTTADSWKQNKVLLLPASQMHNSYGHLAERQQCTSAQAGMDGSQKRMEQLDVTHTSAWYTSCHLMALCRRMSFYSLTCDITQTAQSEAKFMWILHGTCAAVCLPLLSHWTGLALWPCKPMMMVGCWTSRCHANHANLHATTCMQPCKPACM